MRLRSPADVVIAVPYLVGFHPADSLAILACGGSDGSYVARLDLTAGDDLVEHVVRLVARRAAPEVILVGYGPAARVTPMIDRAGRSLARSGVEVREVLRVHEGRFWSHPDGGRRPDHGTPIDAGHSVIAAQATADGMVALPTRAELESIVAPADDERMRHATEQAERRLLTHVRKTGEPFAEHLIEEGIHLVRKLAERTRTGEEPPSDDEVARLGIMLTSLRVRDEAWVRMDEIHPAPCVTFWSDITRRVTQPYTPAPAALLAFAAWRRGEGALANIALDRALTTNPHYSMALLLHELFTSGIPPTAISLNPNSLDQPTPHPPDP